MTVILAKMWRDIIGAAIAEVEIEIPSYNTTIGVKLKVSSNTQERHIPPCFLLDYSQKLRYRTSCLSASGGYRRHIFTPWDFGSYKQK